MTASQYNRAFDIDVFPDRIAVHTEEIGLQVAQALGVINGVYEFSPELRIQRAYFNDRYWDLHRRLEQKGKISHSRAECPERDGPVLIQSWSPEAGWKDIELRKTSAPSRPR